MMEIADLVVVGAGPAGCAAALTARRLGVESVVVLERDRPGRPKTCAGGLGPRARKVLRDLDCWPEIEALANPILGLRLTGQRGRTLVLSGTETASVLPRHQLDALLARKAEEAGASLCFHTKVEDLLLEGDRVVGVRAAGVEVRGRFVIDASGAHSRLGGPPLPAREILTCMQWWEGLPADPNRIEMYFVEPLLPHYGWLFPEPGGQVNIGLCVRQDRIPPGSLRRVFEDFLERFFSSRLSLARPVGPLRGHPIRPALRVDHRAPPGLLKVGEANRLVNGATGEGIPQALESGAMAARMVAEGLRHGWSPDRIADAYRAWLTRRFRLSFLVAEGFQRYGVRAVDWLTRFGDPGWARRAAADVLARV